MTINLPTKLPNQPSALIRLAIADLNKAKDDPNVDIHMGQWLWFINKDECTVCLAGAVMKYSLGVDIGFLSMIERDPDEFDNEEITPADFNAELRNKLSALNAFRCGEIQVGCRKLGIKTQVVDRPVAEYIQLGHDEFCRRMLRLADEFQREGN